MENNELKKARDNTVLFGRIVYTGIVIAATVLFIGFVLLAFDEKAYATRLLMGTAGFLVGMSALVFPFAIENWAVSGWHRIAALLFYYGEMGILLFNTVISFSTLLGKYSGYVVPDWVIQFEPYTIGGMVYSMLAWGTLFVLDPASENKKEEIKAEQDFNREVSKLMVDFVKTDEGKRAVRDAAIEKINKQYIKSANAWDNVPTPVEMPTVNKYNATVGTPQGDANFPNANTK